MTKKFTTHNDPTIHTVLRPLRTSPISYKNFSSVDTNKEPHALRLGSTVVTEEDLEDLVTLMDVLKNMPDDHPLAELKQQMRTHKAFKKLEGHTQ